jgi:hypothetical protein
MYVALDLTIDPTKKQFARLILMLYISQEDKKDSLWHMFVKKVENK